MQNKKLAEKEKSYTRYSTVISREHWQRFEAVRSVRKWTKRVLLESAIDVFCEAEKLQKK